MLAPTDIEQMVVRLREQLSPRRIVLFGSYANGSADDDSDVDLLVVADTELAPAKRSALVARLFRDLPVDVDAIVKTPDEYQHARCLLNHIVYFADRYGTVLYEQ